MNGKIIIACLLVAASAVSALDWAVLVAGSNTYGNYRHQSDICHAYQIVAKGGIPAERIIVMQFDDIANNRQNPYPGKIFNKPTPVGTPGVDVYAGCQKDYVGATVTATNVINVLTGNSAAMQGVGNGKVLKSGPNDNVFFFYSDHGTVGEVEMPSGGPLYASKFTAALQLMHQRNMYNKMVVYIESCESGSMFNNLLPKDISVYATSASSPTESSWGCYCPPQDQVNGKSIGSCLGDLYSVNWMEDTDKFGMGRTLQDQFLNVQKLTTQSKVMQWGDLSFTNMTIGKFQGEGQIVEEAPAREFTGAEPSIYSADELRSMSAVSTYDIPMHLAYYSYLRQDGKDFSATQSALAELMTELNMRAATDKMFHQMTTVLAGANANEALVGRSADVNWECLNVAKRAYVINCGEFTDYARKYVRVMNNLCLLPGVSIAQIEGQLSAMCPYRRF
jgi:legumain